MGDDLTREQLKAGESQGRGSPRRRCSVAQAKSSQRAGSHSAGPDASSTGHPPPHPPLPRPLALSGSSEGQMADLPPMPPSSPGSGRCDWLRRRPCPQASRIRTLTPSSFSCVVPNYASHPPAPATPAISSLDESHRQHAGAAPISRKMQA